MRNSVTRRTFLAGLAGVTAACASKTAIAGTHPLTIYYTGLMFFQHDTINKKMKIGLMDYKHETTVVARLKDVETPGSALNGDQLSAWNPTEMDVQQREMTYWQGKKLAFNLATTDALSVKAPFGVFRVEPLAKQAAELTAAQCQSYLEFSNGDFSGHRRAHVKCGHEKAKFQMVKDPSDMDPPMKDVSLVDTVRQQMQITSGEFTIDRTTVKFKPGEVRLWVLQHVIPVPDDHPDHEILDPKEIVHCQHYYDFVKGYAGIRYYPRRNDTLPADCKPQRDADPIYCTPGEP